MLILILLTYHTMFIFNFDEIIILILMKTIQLICIFLLSVPFAFSQSKKDLQVQVDSLVYQIKKFESQQLNIIEKNKTIENELKNLQLNLTNVTTTMSFVSKSNLELENIVKSQTALIQKLSNQNDSLLKVFNVSGEPKFILSPQNETDSIIYVIQQYYKAKKWEDRLPFVINSEAMKPLMAEAYRDEFNSYSIEKSQISVPGSNFPISKTFKVFVDGNTVYIKKTKDGFKIDWEATTGYNPKSIAAFKSEKSTIPTTFRTTLKLNDFYWDSYGLTKSNFLSLRMDEVGSCFFSTSNSGITELKKLLADGKEHQLIIEAQHKIFYSEDVSTEQVIITKFIKDGWDK